MKLLLFFFLFSYSMVSCFNMEKYQKILSDKPCSQNSDCLENSFCVQPGLCKCREGWYLLKNQSSYECFQAVDTIYSTCDKDIMCQITLGLHSYCEMSEGRCECTDDGHYDKGVNRCFETVILGGQCTESRQCILPDNTYAICEYGKCTCAFNQHVSEDGRCITNIPLGEFCNNDESCRHADGICSGICSCGSGRVISNDEERCLEAATEFGENCTQLSQCTKYLKGSVCENGKCSCVGGFHPYGIACYHSANPGEICNDPRECYVNGNDESKVDCLTGECKCLKGNSINGSCREEDKQPSGAAAYKIVPLMIFLSMIVKTLN